MAQQELYTHVSTAKVNTILDEVLRGLTLEAHIVCYQRFSGLSKRFDLHLMHLTWSVGVDNLPRWGCFSDLHALVDVARVLAISLFL